jgi:excinuclease ABC subunit A
MQVDISKIDQRKIYNHKRAQVHNLKNVDVVIPRNKLVVITGLSGLRKSSLAFDTLYRRATSYETYLRMQDNFLDA